MQLKEVMARDIDGVGPESPLADALRALKQRGGEPLPVYDEERLVGMLTERDVIAWEAEPGRDLNAARVRDAMRRDVVYGYEDQDVTEAARAMRERHSPGMVVLKHNGASETASRPVGVVSMTDLVDSTRGEMMRAGLPARIFLQPIAAPSILGLYGFAGATFMVAASMAGWFGSSTTPLYLFPFAAFFGGLAQFLAGMWSYRARDGLATAMHGMWGSFWMAYGLLFLLAATGTVTIPTGTFTELGYWFIVLAAITWVGTIAALAENIVLTGVLGFLAAGSTVAAIFFLTGIGSLELVAGWLFIIAAVIAWYLASAMMLEGTFKRVVIPLGKYRSEANVPGSRLTAPIQYELGQPGVRAGQ